MRWDETLVSNSELYLLSVTRESAWKLIPNFSEGVHCAWCSSHQPPPKLTQGELLSQTQSLWWSNHQHIDQLSSQAAGSALGLVHTVCLPWHPELQLHLCSPRCQGFQNKGGSVLVLVLVTKQYAPAQATTHLYDYASFPHTLPCSFWIVCWRSWDISGYFLVWG